MSDPRLKKGHERKAATDKPRPQFCPCCRAPLVAITRVYTKPRYRFTGWTMTPGTSPEVESFDRRDVKCWACEACGIRVVLHVWPPRETWCDREFQKANAKAKR